MGSVGPNLLRHMTQLHMSLESSLLKDLSVVPVLLVMRIEELAQNPKILTGLKVRLGVAVSPSAFRC